MRTYPAVLLVLASSLTACDNPDPGNVPLPYPEPYPGDGTEIQIRSTRPLSLAAYRDVDDPVWHAADQRSPTLFVARVRGPYLVATVCETDADLDGEPRHDVDVVQQGRTLDEGSVLDTYCVEPPATTNVRGQMLRAGRVIIGETSAESVSPDWSFDLPVAAGVHTLYASTSDRVVIRRGIDATRDVALAPIDIDREGTALSPFELALNNADPGATVSVAVRIEQQSASFPGTLYYGAARGARVIPSAALTSDDNQTVSVSTTKQALENGATRDYRLAQRRPFRIGDEATWTLPAQLTGVAWSTDGKAPEVRWQSLPPLTHFIIEINGSRAGAAGSVSYRADLSPAVLATGVTRVAFDVERLLGFKPTWQLDEAAGYTRDVLAQRLANPTAPEHGVIDSSEISDVVGPLR